MIAFHEVSIGTGGVASCVLCAGGADPVSAGPRPLAEVAGALDTVVSAGADVGAGGVSFVGFEPFAHPDLPAIIAAARERGFTRIRLTTDAGALALSQNVRGVLEAGVRHLEVVTLGDEATHDRLVGFPGRHSAAIAGVGAFLEAACEAGVTVALTGLVRVCRHNATVAPEAAARLAGLGAVAVGIDVTGADTREEPYVLAALESAATNRAAGYVLGDSRAVRPPRDRAPWVIVGTPS